jgi:2-C-methyl-D-erythritol 4-phosphate cytidylyltransferase
MNARVNKVFIEVEGRSILERSLALFQSASSVDELVLVARASDLKRCSDLPGRYPKLSRIVSGGKSRHLSEYAGLAAIAGRIDAGEIDAVLVHDAVRPFASGELIERLLSSVDGAVGCIPALPSAYPIVAVADGWASDYPRDLWAVQTPQAFQATWLLEAHNKAARQGFVGTDTASVVEWAGGDVAVIRGEVDNIKITTPADLARAAEIAAKLAR